MTHKSLTRATQLQNQNHNNFGRFVFFSLNYNKILPDPLPMVKARPITRECGSEGREREREMAARSNRAGAGLPRDAVTGPSRGRSLKQTRDLDHHCQQNTINTTINLQFVGKVVKGNSIDLSRGLSRGNFQLENV